MKRLRLALLAAAATAALGLAGAGWVFSGIILNPDRAALLRQAYEPELRPLREAAARTGGGAFSVHSELGYELNGLHFRSRPANGRFVVLVHGYGNDLRQYRDQIPMWLALGFDVFAYDQCDSGQSGGRFITCGVNEAVDLGSVVAFARTRVAPGALCGVLGRSMGGAVVLLYAGRGGPCDFVVSECPFTSFREEALYRMGIDYPFIPRAIGPVVWGAAAAAARLRANVSLGEADPMSVVARVQCPLLFINTAEDRYVPTTMTQRLFDHAGGRKRLRVFPRGGHAQAFAVYPEQYRSEIASFLEDLSGSPTSPAR